MQRRIFIALVAIMLPLCALPQFVQQPDAPKGWTRLSYDRMIKPAGDLIFLGDSTREFHALDVALSPDQQWLAVEERYSVAFIDTRTNKVAYSLRLDSIPQIKYAMCTYSGIRWYRTAGRDWVIFGASKTSTASYVVVLQWDGISTTVSKVFTYKPQAPASIALPNELLVTEEAGRACLYVVLNGHNQLLKQDLQTGDTLWKTETGVAPYGIALARNKLYVTNWAGRMPDAGDADVAGAPWGSARIDPATAATREGSVSVIDPASGHVLREIVTGLHPNDIVASPAGDFVYLTCSNSDRVDVIRTETDEITGTIPVRLQGELHGYGGDSPNGLALSPDGKLLLVANGMDNAVAVIRLGSQASAGGSGLSGTVSGYIPTAAYPAAVCLSEKNILYVANLESFGPNRPYRMKAGLGPIYNSHRMTASVSVIPMPGAGQLARYTRTVIAGSQMARLDETKLPPRPGVAPKPVPERIGEPSVFKHVLYIIKENRTYDQVLGDAPRGNGDSTLCVYGRNVTPNTHRLVEQFHLMDNFFVSGKCSAEGHSWTNASIVTDYVEKNMRAWFRSYPHVLEDALVYPSTGFIWDNARNHGVSVKIYGEACNPVFDSKLTWTDIYTNFLNGKPFVFRNSTTLSTVGPLLDQNFPGYDGHKIPDVLRAQAFINDLARYEAMPGDSLPQLMVMALPNDHTSGTSPGFPTPRAMIADNDLALGRIMEALTKSRFWQNTVVFVTEDDSQDGWDHVSAYRTVGLVISPFSQSLGVVSQPYNQPSMVRTIEQILGLPPMNIQDAIALPMTACFGGRADLTPYAAVPNQVPLDEMNRSLSSLTGKALHYAKLSMDPMFEGIDKGDDDLFNRILWHDAMGAKPYPALTESDK